MEMYFHRGYKYELKVNNKGRSYLTACAGTARFTWNWALAKRLKKFKDKEDNTRFTNAIELHRELNKLKKHFKKVYEGAIPNDLFNSRSLPRISQFKIKGIKTAFVRSFSKKLIRSGEIQYFDSTTKFPQYVQKVIEPNIPPNK